MQITLYTTGCPKCKILEAKMAQKNISPTATITDVDFMLSLGMRSVPYLEVDGKRMDFSASISWINKQGVN